MARPRQRQTKPRRAIFMVALAVLGLVVVAPRQEPMRAGAEVLPDLAMAPLGRSHGGDWRIQWVNGRRLLRFTGMFVNVGSGHFEVCGSRPNTSSPMTVYQVIYQSTDRAPQNGTCAPQAMRSRTIRTEADARYAGDGHNHWHVQEVVRYDLWGGEGTFRGAKVGFCFLDSDPYNGSLPGYSGGYYQYSWCKTDPNALTNRMGLSVGMGDEYEWFLAWQWIDITGLPSGTYTVRAKVDPYGYFVEENETNQCAYAVVSFTTGSNAVNVQERAHECVNDWAGSSYGEHVGWMLEEGISTGCAPDLFCTYNDVTRGEMAAFLDRALDLPPTPEDFFDDDETSTFEVSINRLAAAGVTSGCGERQFCPNRTITRGEMAAFLERAFALPAATADYYTDDTGTMFEDSINAVTEAGIANGCAESRYCPGRSVTRGEMAAFIHRAEPYFSPI